MTLKPINSQAEARMLDYLLGRDGLSGSRDHRRPHLIVADIGRRESVVAHVPALTFEGPLPDAKQLRRMLAGFLDAHPGMPLLVITHDERAPRIQESAKP